MFQAKQLKKPYDLWLERNPAALIETRTALLTTAWSKATQAVVDAHKGITIIERRGDNLIEHGTLVPAYLYYTVVAHRNTELEEMPVMHVETHLFKREPRKYLAHVADNYNLVLLNSGWPRIVIASQYFRDTQLSVTDAEGHIDLTEFNKERFASFPFKPVYVDTAEAAKLFNDANISLDLEGLDRPCPGLVKHMDIVDERILEDVIDVLIAEAGPDISAYQSVIDRVVIDRELGRVSLNPAP